MRKSWQEKAPVSGQLGMNLKLGVWNKTLPAIHALNFRQDINTNK